MPSRVRFSRRSVAAAALALAAFACAQPCDAGPNDGANAGQSAAAAVQWFIDVLTQPAGSVQAPRGSHRATPHAVPRHAAPPQRGRPAARKPVVDTAVRQVPAQHGAVAQWHPPAQNPHVAAPATAYAQGNGTAPQASRISAPKPAPAPPKRLAAHGPSLAQLNARAESDAASRLAVGMLRTSAFNVGSANAHLVSYGKYVDVDAVVRANNQTLHRKVVLQRTATGFKVVSLDPRLHSDTLRRKAGLATARPAPAPAAAATDAPTPDPSPSPTSAPRRVHALIHHRPSQ